MKAGLTSLRLKTACGTSTSSFGESCSLTCDSVARCDASPRAPFSLRASLDLLMFTTLVRAEELATHLSEPDWVVFDCRHDLTDYEHGRRNYLESHIPGALFLHLDEDLSGTKTGVNGRHPLPHPRTFALRLGALGVGKSTQV